MNSWKNLHEIMWLEKIILDYNDIKHDVSTLTNMKILSTIPRVLILSRFLLLL